MPTNDPLVDLQKLSRFQQQQLARPTSSPVAGGSGVDMKKLLPLMLLSSLGRGRRGGGGGAGGLLAMVINQRNRQQESDRRERQFKQSLELQKRRDALEIVKTRLNAKYAENRDRRDGLREGREKELEKRRVAIRKEGVDIHAERKKTFGRAAAEEIRKEEAEKRADEKHEVDMENSELQRNNIIQQGKINGLTFDMKTEQFEEESSPEARASRGFQRAGIAAQGREQVLKGEEFRSPGAVGARESRQAADTATSQGELKIIKRSDRINTLADLIAQKKGTPAMELELGQLLLADDLIKNPTTPLTDQQRQIVLDKVGNLKGQQSGSEGADLFAKSGLLRPGISKQITTPVAMQMGKVGEARESLNQIGLMGEVVKSSLPSKQMLFGNRDLTEQILGGLMGGNSGFANLLWSLDRLGLDFEQDE